MSDEIGGADWVSRAAVYKAREKRRKKRGRSLISKKKFYGPQRFYFAIFGRFEQNLFSNDFTSQMLSKLL